MVSKRSGIIITIFGYISGLVIEGDFLRSSVKAILPFNEVPFIVIALAVAIVVFLIAHKMRVPQSLSVNFTSILIGISFAMHFSLNLLLITMIILFWIVAPIISIILIRPLMRLLYSFARRRSIWRVVKELRLSLILLSFFAAFTLGANTLGLLYSAMPHSSISLLIALLGIVFGSIFLSRGELARVGDEILSLRYINAINSQFVSVALVELATILGIPLSNTQTYIAGIYGSGISYKNRILLKAPLRSIALAWLGGAFASLALSYIFTIFIINLL